MKLSRLLTITAVFLMAMPSFGICPTIFLSSFDKERGFGAIIAYKYDKEGVTGFQISVNPRIFLSHFRHGFPPNRAEARIALRAKNDGDFKGVSVELGRIGFDDPDLELVFDVPSTDLDRYELEFDCSITTGANGMPIMGGEIHKASLQSFRDAKEAVTEASPIWKGFEKQHQEMRRGDDYFGAGSIRVERLKKAEQAAPSGGDTPSN